MVFRHFSTHSVTVRHKALVRTDAGVPLSALAEYIDWAVSYAAPKNVYTFGHIGIGILHLLLPFDPDSESDTLAAMRFRKEAALKAVSLGGTVSGEHGIGLGNRDSALLEYGGAIRYMREIKRVFDPMGIMNPGKVL